MSASLGFGSSSSKTNSSHTSQTDPWDTTIPYLTDFLKNVGGTTSFGQSPDQQAAFTALKSNAAQGNPWTGQIAGLADQAFATPDRTAGVTSADATLKSNLSKYADGSFLDVMNNPQLKALLDSVGTDAFNKINAQFAGAGRDLSGANQQVASRGVAQATAPLLLDQFNRQQQLQLDANKTLAGNATTTATTQAQLDAQRLAQQQAGIGLGKEALAAKDYAGNQILSLDQQQKQLPLQDLGLLASILFPAAGLGAQESGTGTSKSSSSGFSFGLSDERAKEGIEKIGDMEDGTPIYRWRYKGDPTWQVGPMAQDIEKKYPAAVRTGEDGLKYVNLKAATNAAAKLAAAGQETEGDE